MDFGRLPDISKVDFKLPPDHLSNAGILKNRKNQHNTEFFVGCPVWTSTKWIGKIFPSDTKSKDFLHHYAKNFNAIELNATHYKIPDHNTVLKWRQAVLPCFRFFPKISKQLNHDAGLKNIERLLEQYCDAIKQLGNNLGMCLLQLPPYFSIEKLADLKAFLVVFSSYNIPLAVEFRHPTWFTDCKEHYEIFDLLSTLGFSTVITDVAGRRDAAHMRLTGTTAFIRFGANNLHVTDYERLNAWVQRISAWKEQGLEQLCFFIHTPDKGLCIELSIYLIDLLNARLGSAIKKPVLLNQGLQMHLF